MSKRPSKLLLIEFNLEDAIKFDDVSSMPYAWNASLYINEQPHSYVNEDENITGFYNGLHVNVGDYLTTTNSGLALKITKIVERSVNNIKCVVEDYNLINSKLIHNQTSESGIPNGEGILFEVNNNMPILYPLPDALPGVFNPSFPSQLISRFQLYDDMSVYTYKSTEPSIEHLIEHNLDSEFISCETLLKEEDGSYVNFIVSFKHLDNNRILIESENDPIDIKVILKKNN